MKRVLLIYNPKAGKGVFPEHLSDVVDVFVSAGYRVEVHPTQHAGDGGETAEALAGEFDLVVAAGGDGAMDEVISGLCRSGNFVPIGFIPVGSTNDFAQSLGMPGDPVEAAREIVGGEVVTIDIGRFNEAHFLYVAAFGVFTSVAYKTSQDMKNIFGRLAYLAEAGRQLNEIKSEAMTVETDDGVLEGKFIFGMVTNSLSVGGVRFIMGRDITLNDGLFEVMLIHEPETLMEWQDVIRALMTDEPSLFVRKFKTKHIVFHSENEVEWTLDGEFGGRLQECRIDNLHNHMPLMLGKWELKTAVEEAVLQEDEDTKMGKIEQNEA
ncbi:MAG: YegS/Rv2252/BmrU family lipid kinase [Lachnospiraceae bacterium]|nr:YegS/Rv2252/BmrU family lipid kinase [Lachnospiraceae bacterium]